MQRSHRIWQGILVAGLVLLITAGVQALDELPDFQPFRSLVTEGAIHRAPGGDPPLEPAFLQELDARFRLAPGSNGIEPGDDVHIQTSAAFPVAGSETLGRLAVRVSVAGECFRRRGRRLVYRLTKENQEECVELGIEPFIEPFFDVLRRLEVTLAPAGGSGRWRLTSAAVFADPGFPFPVMGFADPAARLSGVTLVVGDDGMYSPTVALEFRTLAP